MPCCWRRSPVSPHRTRARLPDGRRPHRLRHRPGHASGPFVGLLGLAGGFVTPAIVHTDEPNALGLFAFLLAMQVGTQVLVCAAAGWWWLAPIAVAAG